LATLAQKENFIKPAATAHHNQIIIVSVQTDVTQLRKKPFSTTENTARVNANNIDRYSFSREVWRWWQCISV